MHHPHQRTTTVSNNAPTTQTTPDGYDDTYPIELPHGIDIDIDSIDDQDDYQDDISEQILDRYCPPKFNRHTLEHRRRPPAGWQ